MTNQPNDPFAPGGEKKPSVSFDGAAPGTTYTLTVTDLPESVQLRNFDTEELDFWPAKGTEAPKPKMGVVIGVEQDGEAKNLWVKQYPKYLFEAIQAAQNEAGERIAVGGTLLIRYTGDGKKTDAKKHAPKLYAAKYTPPAPVDAFADPAPWGQPAAQDEPPF